MQLASHHKTQFFVRQLTKTGTLEKATHKILPSKANFNTVILSDTCLTSEAFQRHVCVWWSAVPAPPPQNHCSYQPIKSEIQYLFMTVSFPLTSLIDAPAHLVPGSTYYSNNPSYKSKILKIITTSMSQTFTQFTRLDRHFHKNYLMKTIDYKN